MRIGLTYDLKNDYLKEGYSLEQIAEFDCEETIEALMTNISILGHDVDPIGNVKALVKRLANGDRWDLVFNIAEGVKGMGREAQVPALLEAYDIPVTFSGSDLMALTLNKAMTNAVLKSYGIATADFFLVKCEKDIDRMPLAYPVFAKPVAEGTSKGISNRSCVHNPLELRNVCQDLLATFHQPVLVETYLPGREFTVGIVGSGENAYTIGTAEIVLGEKADQSAYTYDNKQLYADRVRYELVKDAAVEELALNAWRALGCLDAGRIDVRLDKNDRPCFIEVNPLAGLNPTYSDLPILANMAGISYAELIQKIISSAKLRFDANVSLKLGTDACAARDDLSAKRLPEGGDEICIVPVLILPETQVSI